MTNKLAPAHMSLAQLYEYKAGVLDCANGVPAPTGQREAYYSGYSNQYHTEQTITANIETAELIK